MPSISKSEIERALDTWAQHLQQRAAAVDAPLAIVGIVSHGDILAQRLVQRLQVAGCDALYGAIDITLYRDDLDMRGNRPALRSSHLPFSTDGLHLVLVDDVLSTGRTARAALEVLWEYGRPAQVELQCLADRGGRQLPIHPDYVAFNLSTEPVDKVVVHLQEIDGEEDITY
ncbi:MAG: bifunctional pyr operon transcriptional regulator/uracil phosphoribosyltransferase PyrR [Akkermansia sp.]|nr:bifunctional pyr operon transcriptional regulator/uracil phosphoribosyltransferase PyrR [Akkermansia sp.]MBQ7023392.1 bifunctional pyr operon transcriptional regulator/uracil phosphoribosyltransferase PyrR [Akkermansia sp.]